MIELKKIDALECEAGKCLAIAGPCSAESEEQIMTAAHALAAQGVRIFRAGIWKPRTKPGCFEGVGAEGLAWLQRVQKETGMLVAVEIANAQHAEQALKAGVDILWIGARTTVNPFAVQEVADSLRGTDMPVLVKNPVNPDLDLWIGALERLDKVGLHKLGVIHRGFSSYGESRYRNAPQWQIAIELKRRIPGLPVICDPSHMGGKREFVQPLSQLALDLGMDGLMIEVHPCPDCALSDSKQQLTPDDFGAMIETLKVRGAGDADVLKPLREHLDVLDGRILEMLAERFATARRIGELKKENNMPVLQSERYNDTVEKMAKKGESMGIDNLCVSRIYEAIHAESIRQQLGEETGNNIY